MGIVRQIYFYGVCLITLIMIISGGVSAISNLSDIIYPNTYYESYSSYRDSIEYERNYQTNQGNVVMPLDEEKIKSDYEAGKKESEEQDIRYSKNRLIGSLAWILVPLPFFIWSSRVIKRERTLKNS